MLNALAAIPPAQWRTGGTDLPEVAVCAGASSAIGLADGLEAPFLVVHGEIDEIAPAAEGP